MRKVVDRFLCKAKRDSVRLFSVALFVTKLVASMCHEWAEMLRGGRRMGKLTAATPFKPDLAKTACRSSPYCLRIARTSSVDVMMRKEITMKCDLGESRSAAAIAKFS